MLDERTVIAALRQLRDEFCWAEFERLDRLYLQMGSPERQRELRQYPGSTAEELARRLMPRNGMPGYDDAIAHLAVRLEEHRPRYSEVTREGPWRCL